MSWPLLVIFLCSFCANSSSGQSMSYDIFIKDKNVGNMIVKESQSEDTISYLIKTNIHIDIVFTIDINHTIRSSFLLEKFCHSMTKNIVNGREKEFTETYTRGSKTYFRIDDKDIREIDGNIDHTIASLYFNEPVGAKSVYSERFGEHLSLNYVAPGKYEVTLPNGKTNMYHYKSGNCWKVISEQTMADITIIKRK